MAISLMHSLAGMRLLEIERVARSYRQWFESDPFDLGGTTTTGLSGGVGQPDGGVHEGMWTAAWASMDSKANGLLMRIAPLGVWGHRIGESALVEAARLDAMLTHPHPTCQAAGGSVLRGNPSPRSQWS
jgi:ADP-ribosyl-[dinitrogen reductase] hydrolase